MSDLTSAQGGDNEDAQEMFRREIKRQPQTSLPMVFETLLEL